MSAVQMGFKGGLRMNAYLAALQAAVGGAGGVRVGFLENATYPGTPSASGKPRPRLHIATVAFWNEFGTRYAKARPFFRQMIARESPTWGEKLGQNLRAARFDSATALQAMGIEIKDALVTSIVGWPADNAPSTAARKGFNKGLIDKGSMQRAPDFEVLK
jgi:hypothetical protein